MKTGPHHIDHLCCANAKKHVRIFTSHAYQYSAWEICAIRPASHPIGWIGCIGVCMALRQGVEADSFKPDTNTPAVAGPSRRGSCGSFDIDLEVFGERLGVSCSRGDLAIRIWNMGMCQNLVPLVNIKIAGKWMFIPLKMVCIGIDP